ncbi:hypothetical protein [Archaeoglobus sp. UBA231]|jgi:hypothetical protein|nr:hypothetical protein [Archaeoglobus sp. UBA231]
MLKELKAAAAVLDSIKQLLENTELKEKWQKEKKIKGRLLIEGYEIQFLIKEVEYEDRD